ncbi:tubby C-terminal-like domain-containing protein [Gorgonomyces haynaldii]|nr:tubby C-terminal-like domain-containing protein [Gorgonomyces haynaldii]
MVLTLVEKVDSRSKDDFAVFDSMGQVWFHLDCKSYSMKGQRILKDRNRQPIMKMEKRLLSLTQKWQCKSSGGQLLFTIEPKLMAFKPTVNVYLQDGDRHPDYYVKGSRDKHSFDIFKSDKTMAATCHHENHGTKNDDSYYLSIFPGADISLCVAICLTLDELYHD